MHCMLSNDHLLHLKHKVTHIVSYLAGNDHIVCFTYSEISGNTPQNSVNVTTMALTYANVSLQCKFDLYSY